jgi:hypothetical protein
MAQRVHVLLVCDLHEEDVEGTETVALGLDGSAYEIDVCDEHAAQMREALAPYVGAARRAGRASAGPPSRRSSRSASRPATAGSDRERVQAIRDWARRQGYTISDRGRLSAEVLAAYEAAQ